jgi:hypothetical protein
MLIFLAIGDRILTAPQSFGRIVTLPDAEIAMIQLDHVLAINGAMISNGSLTDHTNYVNIGNFQWDPIHEYWRPKFAFGDRCVEFNAMKVYSAFSSEELRYI